MASGARTSRVSGPVVAALLVAACGGAAASPTANPSRSVTETAEAQRPSAAPEPTRTPSPSPSPVVGIDLPAPDRPYDAEMLLAAMRSSRRPGGVPDQLETRPIAGALAERIWTFGGASWSTASAGGSCGPELCTFEIGGTPADAQGEDLYIFSVAPASGAVELLDTTLRGIPLHLLDEIDAAARRAWEGDLSGLVLASVRWLPPPDDGRFVLSYRSGGEEGAPAVDLLLDAEAGTAEAL